MATPIPEIASAFILLWPVYRVVKVIFIIADILLAAGFLYALMQGLKYRPKFKLQEKRVGKLTLRTAVFRDRWHSVLRKFSTEYPESMRLGIIEADSLVDSILKDMGLEGEHMADRLSRIDPESFQSLQALWRAHRLRNELVHTPGFSLSSEDAKKAIADYESFLREVRILQ